MRTSRASIALPIPVRRVLRKLGSDIRDARRRRRIPVQLAAERASISRMTLLRIEKGEPGVAMGSYPTVDKALSASYAHKAHRISIRTINLNQPWPEIHRDLLALVA